ncbi:LysE family translocator [Hellea sp.]|nr:LysE family translocator [Hellea sp.]MDA8888151.1 LysE family translocator [Hellea sp.]MDB4844068.1 LysE family translocator [Hellea sp.]MDC0421908.1 LysE family translocator [Hellea sp.]MDC0650934.1 LysE family translocator [Hellea sp.]MDC1061850.1 LysE family translocator [Hellea sp.]
MSFELWLALVALFGVGGLTPGPAVMLVMSSSFRYGFKSAMLPALGIASANTVWLLMAASGAAILATKFHNAFLVLKGMGLLVIFYLALSTIFGPLPDTVSKVMDPPRKKNLYSKGLALQLSSPMPLVYFGLLLPNYFDMSYSLKTQVLVMFLTVTITELLGLGLYAYCAHKIRQWLKQTWAARSFNILIGLTMIASGVWALMATTEF